MPVIRDAAMTVRLVYADTEEEIILEDSSNVSIRTVWVHKVTTARCDYYPFPNITGSAWDEQAIKESVDAEWDERTELTISPTVIRTRNVRRGNKEVEL